MTIPPLPADLSLRSSPAGDPPPVVERTRELLAEHERSIWTRTDRLFAHLLMFEWLGAIIVASALTPRQWAGQQSWIHPHVWAALLTGAAIVAGPIALAAFLPGRASTRHVIAAGQVLIGALLVHLTGGRVETHFHVFGSLAFLAFYRDWRVLVTATLLVVAHHVAGSLFLPASVYGVARASLWRTLEHGGWVAFMDLFLVTACVRGVREMRGIARNRALLEHAIADVERQVEDRTRELQEAQANLVKAARTAGMAEIATSVLHNVGNALNSVNVSATVVGDRLRHSEVASLGQVSALLAEHEADLGQFLTADERGRMVPGFIAELSSCLQQEHDAVIGEIASLAKGVDHIKQIVAAQQSMAKRSTVRTSVDPRAVMETALSLVNPGKRQGIEFVRQFADDVGPVPLDEHKVLQILINLMTNACQASVARPGRSRQVTLACERAGAGDRLRLRVSDNGVGIAAENLSRIFAHGFTTKKDGHGFGLHSAANAATEMGGSLGVSSDGLNLGATFTLDLPIAAAEPDATAAADDEPDSTDAQESPTNQETSTSDETPVAHETPTPAAAPQEPAHV